MGVRVIIRQFKVFVFEIEDAFYIGVQFHFRQGSRFARKLFPHLLDMVVVNMGISECVDEISGFEPGHLCDHHE